MKVYWLRRSPAKRASRQKSKPSVSPFLAEIEIHQSSLKLDADAISVLDVWHAAWKDAAVRKAIASPGNIAFGHRNASLLEEIHGCCYRS
ncbi:MAG TPA: hypothetical protein VN280_11445 [Variovorax sp.]|nr:hypothetical protein [Variovorax sp.]